MGACRAYVAETLSDEQDHGGDDCDCGEVPARGLNGHPSTDTREEGYRRTTDVIRDKAVKNGQNSVRLRSNPGYGGAHFAIAGAPGARYTGFRGKRGRNLWGEEHP